MENLQITWTTILAFFGALSVIAGGVKVIIQMFAPFKEIKKTLLEHTQQLKKHDELLHNDKDALDSLRSLQRENMRVNVALLNHFIEGNGIDKMKLLRDEIEDKIFEVTE